MRKLRTIGVLGALVLGTIGAAAVASPAAATLENCKTVKARITDKPESPAWALDTYTRTVKVCKSGVGSYHAVVTDDGSFVTIAGAKSPGTKGVELPGGVTGSFKGGFTADFEAAPNFASFTWSNGEVKDFKGTDAPATPTFVKSLFGEEFKGSSINDNWKWIYKTCSETWVNATEAVGGNKGDVTGKPCPSPEPTTSPTVAPTASPTAVPTSPGTEVPSPTAAPGAGGGEADDEGSLPVTGAGVIGMGALALVLIGGGAALYVVTRRRRVRFTA